MRPMSSPPMPKGFTSLSARTKMVKAPWAKHPSFSNPDADVVLRTVDGVEFRVFRGILIEASTVFRNMFDIPQPPISHSAVKVEPPVVDVAERAPIFNNFLLCLYPLPHPRFETIEELQVMFELARKYDSNTARDILRAQMVSPEMMKKTIPLRLYVLACKEELDEERNITSAACLNIDIDRASQYMEAFWPEELRNWSSLDLVRLFRLRDTRYEAASELVRSIEGKGVCSHATCRHDFAADYFPDFQEAALIELKKSPTSKKIFSHTFVTACLNSEAASCVGCAKEYLATSSGILTNLRKRIDALPDSI